MRPLTSVRHAVGGAASVLVLGLLGQTSAYGSPCPGDCDVDGATVVNEIVNCVNIALGSSERSSCVSCDHDNDGAVTINELIGAVNSALTTCRSEFGEASVGVIASGTEALQIIDLGPAASLSGTPAVRLRSGMIGQGAGAATCLSCPDGGSVAAYDCVVGDGESRLDARFDACRDGSITRTGRVRLTVGDAAFCGLCQIAEGTPVVEELIDYSEDRGGRVASTIGTLTEISLPIGEHCRTLAGQVASDRAVLLMGAVRVGSGDDEVIFAYESFQAVVTSQVVAGSCEVTTVQNGIVRVDDRGANRRFTQAAYDLTRVESELDEGRRQVSVRGGLDVDCLGGAVDVQTLVPLLFEPGSACPRAGILTLALDGLAPPLTTAVRFTASGGVELDLDFGGEFDPDVRAADCFDPQLAECRVALRPQAFPPTRTPTDTPPPVGGSPTSTATASATGTATQTSTSTAATPPATGTATATHTPTADGTATATSSATLTHTASPTPLASSTHTPTRTQSAASTATFTLSPTRTSTPTVTATRTATATSTDEVQTVEEATPRACVSLTGSEPIACGGLVTCSFGTPGDIKVFTFDAQQGDGVAISTARLPGSFVEPHWELRDPDLQPVPGCIATSGGFLTCATLPLTGSYRLSVREGGGDETGAYAVAIHGVGTLNSAPSFTCATDYVCAAVIRADLAVTGDINAYRFAAGLGGGVTITTARLASQFIEPQWSLYAPDGTPVAGCSSTSGGQLSCAPLPAEGTYTLIVRDGGLDESGLYGVSVQFTADLDCCAEPIGEGQGLQSTIAVQGDTDVYAFDAQVGENVLIITASGDIEPQWQLYDPDGAAVADCSTQSGGELSCGPLTKSGTYVVLVNDNAQDETGNYTIVVEGDVTSGTCGG